MKIADRSLTNVEEAGANILACSFLISFAFCGAFCLCFAFVFPHQRLDLFFIVMNWVEILINTQFDDSLEAMNIRKVFLSNHQSPELKCSQFE
jgi:hypothetical protein